MYIQTRLNIDETVIAFRCGLLRDVDKNVRLLITDDKNDSKNMCKGETSNGSSTDMVHRHLDSCVLTQ